MKPVLFSILLLAGSCQQATSQSVSAPVRINPSGMTIETRFSPPPGYVRTVEKPGSWASFLRRSPLKPHGAKVLYFDGRVKENPGIYAAVLTWDVGNRDLQQCADAVMRLRAEYLFSVHRLADIRFHFTDGFEFSFGKWAQGFRLSQRNGRLQWVQTDQPAADHASLRKYLDVLYAYAGTRSLAKELKPVALRDLRIGDVLIVGGSPGHAVTVMDMAVNREGKKVFLLSQSYMPAQDIQVLQNPNNDDFSPWYELDESRDFIDTPQWNFTIRQLMRFAGE